METLVLFLVYVLHNMEDMVEKDIKVVYLENVLEDNHLIVENNHLVVEENHIVVEDNLLVGHIVDNHMDQRQYSSIPYPCGPSIFSEF